MLLSLYLTVVMSAVCLLYCRFAEKRSLKSLGFVPTIPGRWRSALLDYLKGLFFGLAMFSAAVLFGTPVGAFRFAGVSENFSLPVLVLFFGGFLLQGLSEEILCRGYFMLSAARKSSLLTAVIGNSLLFALLHSFNKGISPIAVVNLFLFGFFASVLMLKRGSIWEVAAVHSMWNFAQGNLFGMSVSGTQKTASVFVFEQTGNTLLDGGTFGPEGGLAVTAALLLSTAILLIPGRKKKN